MRVTDLMTPRPHTLAADEGLDAAMDLMDRLEVRHLPVLEDERLVGLLWDRDLLEATGWLPVELWRDADATRAEPRRTVRDVMRAPCEALGPEEPLGGIAQELLLREPGAIPIIERGALVGILTDLDVMAAFAAEARAAHLAAGDVPSVGARMTRSPAMLSPNATLREARALCRELRVHHVPVVEEGVVVGMLSNRDFVRASGRGQPDSLPVAEIMSREVITTSSQESLGLAAHRMVAGRVSSLPVLEAGRLAGLLTATDVLPAALRILSPPEPPAAEE